ncbi:hypothetical protein NJC40_03745 [Pseudomonas sp. 21LCFQ02]|uniref:hypothetical protein n=1 Tax=Pseudomonas sp. 21LCFQ02 TaxID=2957505 RepID=UPI00209B91F8|nr:hypothetical protein [Pseudomonas sp. 21LCFQ02]MCO8166892.1 hypothetical protein [Pseudomonas sp. 21LCFQ02]
MSKYAQCRICKQPLGTCEHTAAQAVDEDAEMAKFERAFVVQEGVFYSGDRKGYRSMNGRSIEETDASDLNLRLSGWLARAAIAAPVQSFTIPDCPDCACVQDGQCLCIPSKPSLESVQSEQEPFRWYSRVLKGSCAGQLIEVDGPECEQSQRPDLWEKPFPVFLAAPVRAVRLPDQAAIQNAILGALAVHRLSFTEGDDGEAFPLIDALTPDGETVAVGRDEIELLAETLSDAVAQLNAQPVGPES